MPNVERTAAAPPPGARTVRRSPACGPLAAALLVAAAVAAAGCEQGAQRTPNLLIVVVDTLRADRLGAYGNERGLTPFLDELAARAVVFTNAYAVTSWTCPSVASLMTSRFPSQHHVVSFAAPLADGELTLAEALAPLHYVMGGFSANFRLMASLGYGQGFDEWQTRVADIPAAEINERALRWLDSVWSRDSDRPAMLYLQYIDPHAPYDPPEPFRGRFARAGGDAAAANTKLLANRWFLLERADVDLLKSLYDAEVASVDAEMRRLFAELQERGFLDDAIVVVTADHGEEFWEHGNLSHGIALYEESVRVPLIIATPGQRDGRRVDETVSLVDVAPTLLSLLGLPEEALFEGRSLAATHFEERSLGALWQRFLAAAGGDPDILLELEPTGDGLDSREHSAAIRRGAEKLLLRNNGFSELYDLGADPREEDPAPPSQDARGAELQRRLEAERADLRRRAGVVPERAPLDEATREKLRALGYHF